MSQPNNMFNENHLLNVGQENPDFEVNRIIIRQEENGNTSTGMVNMEGQFGNNQNPNAQPNMTKPYRRHTIHQIQEMEKFFKNCPKPSERQRMELGRRLSLEPAQVKFWFQNKRIQVKSQDERNENTQLRIENDKLRAENERYKYAFGCAACLNGGGPSTIKEKSFVREQLLGNENASLREELNRLNAMNDYHRRNTMQLAYPRLPSGAPRNLDHRIGTSSAPQTSLPSDDYLFWKSLYQTGEI